MLTINKLKEFVEEVKTTIPAIKFAQVITNNKDFELHLKARKESENTLLFAVAPNYGLNKRQDSQMYGNDIQFIFVDKTTTKDLKHDEKLAVFNKISLIAKDFVDRISQTKSGNNRDEGGYNINCGMFDYYQEESTEIKLFYDQFECRGYEVFIFLETIP